MTTIKDKLNTFNELCIEHRRFAEVYAEVLDCIQNAVRGTIIVILGPTGVGKTRLKDLVYAVLKEHVNEHPELQQSAPLRLEAKRPEVGEFNWKAFFDQALRRLGEPAMDRKVNLDRVIADLRLQSRSVTYRVLTTPEFRELYEQALDLQRPIATLIDEAQSIGHCNSDERRMANLDVIKGLSNSGTTVYVLFGTYEARNLLRCNAQLARRVCLIDFRRYSDSSDDQTELLSVVQAICKAVGFRLQPTVAKDWWFLYSNSLGCVGILVQWLARALNHAYRHKRVYVSRADMEATRLRSQVLSTIASEMQAFENANKIGDDLGSVSFFRSELDQLQSNSKETTQPASRRRKPGARHPFRDPVGNDDCGPTARA